MAKISASDTSRPLVAMLVKHHFWILALVVPFLLLPLVFLARGKLTSQIEVVREQIKGHLTALQSVRRIPQHPNTSWANDIDTSTMRVKRETFAEWRKFWDSQQTLRVWPESLGPDFVKAVESLKPEGKLSPRLLERYQNNVRMLVRTLPANLGVEEAMKDMDEAGQSPARQQPLRPEMMRPGMGPAGVVPEVSPYVATWNPENQQKIYASFDWDKKPSTAKVLLAQEELWVYGLLCDAVAQINKPATGPHNAAISRIDELYVGYPAAEDNPGGANGGRVIRMVAKENPDGMMTPPPDMMAADGSGAPAGRPPNPRFEGGQRDGRMAAPMASPEEAAGPADADVPLRNWIYVDFAGKPLSAAELEAAIDSQMIHLMPFVLRVVIDQRQIDALLVGLADSAIPIDVRQVRVNAPTSGQSGAGMPSMPSGPSMPDGGGGGGTAGAGRYYDVTLELRGTVGLATPPNEKTVGLEPGQGDAVAPADAGEKVAPAPKAALLNRPTRRRIAS
jgi:hypothetical protein